MKEQIEKFRYAKSNEAKAGIEKLSTEQLNRFELQLSNLAQKSWEKCKLLDISSEDYIMPLELIGEEFVSEIRVNWQMKYNKVKVLTFEQISYEDYIDRITEISSTRTKRITKKSKKK